MYCLKAENENIWNEKLRMVWTCVRIYIYTHTRSTLQRDYDGAICTCKYSCVTACTLQSSSSSFSFIVYYPWLFHLSCCFVVQDFWYVYIYIYIYKYVSDRRLNDYANVDENIKIYAGIFKKKLNAWSQIPMYVYKEATTIDCACETWIVYTCIYTRNKTVKENPDIQLSIMIVWATVVFNYKDDCKHIVDLNFEKDQR